MLLLYIVAFYIKEFDVKAPSSEVWEILGTVMRKYDTHIHLPGYGERRYISTLLVQGNVGMRKHHSLLVMYASAERGRPATMIGTEE